MFSPGRDCASVDQSTKGEGGMRGGRLEVILGEGVGCRRKKERRWEEGKQRDDQAQVRIKDETRL